MAILQAQAAVPNGYLLNSILSLRVQNIANIGYSASTITTIKSNLVTALGKPQAYQSSFARFFGVNASQNASYLDIKKSDLALTNSVNPSAEALLVALLMQAQQFESNSLISNVFVNIFQHYFETSPKPLSIWILTVNLYLKIIYDSSPAPLLNNQITNYSLSINPDDF